MLNLNPHQILFEDKYLIAINKPCGIVVEEDQNANEGLIQSVWVWLRAKEQHPEKCFAAVVHRLDRPVTGVVLFAKKKSTLKDLSEIFRERQVQKTYLAVVNQLPPQPKGRLSHWLRKNAELKKAEVFQKKLTDCKEAVLQYELLESKDTRHLLRIHLETGRYHQIRAQLSAIGCPIAGDALYGSTTKLGPKQIALHASSLSLIHPFTKEPLTINAPLPDEKVWKGFKSL